MTDRPTGEQRINDPLSHFPYKHDEAHRGAAREVRRRVRLWELDDEAEQQLIETLLPFAAAVVDATAAYVAAQEAYLRSPSDETRSDERQAADQLTGARRLARETEESARIAIFGTARGGDVGTMSEG